MSSEQQQERESLTDEQMEVSSAPMPRSRDRAQRASKETQSLGPTPLIVAVESGNVDVVRALIEAGALLDETIALGFSALHIASSLPDRGEITAALASAGANVNLAAEEGVTPLMAAAQHGHTESLSALLAAGADPNQPGEELCTPLHLVAVEGHTHVVGMLCEAGANPTAVMKNDFTPLDFAAEFNHVETAELLCAYGAGLRGDASRQAARAGHTALANWLEASEEYTTPLHHLQAVDPERAYRLLREGADIHACAAPGRPSPYTLAKEQADKGEAPEGSTAALILAASKPWSIETHALFPDVSRTQAAEAMKLAYQLSRDNNLFWGREQALVDVWLTCVLPEAVAR